MPLSIMVNRIEPKILGLKKEALQNLRSVKDKLTEIQRLTGEPAIANLGKFIGEVWVQPEQPAKQSLPPDPRLAAAIRRGESVRAKLKTAEGENLSAEEAAEELGMSKVAVLKRLKTGRLIAWREERQNAFRFPAWQFKNGRVLQGLEEVLIKLRASARLDDFGLMLFFLSHSRFLGNKRPLDLLRDGELHKVLQAAEGYGQ